MDKKDVFFFMNVPGDVCQQIYNQHICTFHEIYCASDKSEEKKKRQK